MLNRTLAHVSFCVIGFFLSSLLSDDAYADTPQEPPHRITCASQNQQYQIISDPLLGTEILDKNNKLLWKMSGWFRAPFISNDGEYCVTKYDGPNLIPQDYSNDMVMLTFWKHGKVLRNVRLKEIIPDKRILKETVSHYYWGYGVDIDEHGKFIVQTADEKRLFFDTRSGKLVTP